MQDGDARGKGLQLVAWRGDDLQDLVQDEQARHACLLERLGHDLGGNALDLDVHLQGGDAITGAGDLEVHITEVVFHALDIGQDGVLIAFFDQAHGNAGHWSLDRHTSIHQGQG